MTKIASEHDKAFVLPQKTANSTRQPLEVYHLSHDLRGPLNSILGFAELLLEGIEGPLNEIQEADITAIYQSARNLLALINNVVDLSKLEAQRLNFDLGSVELNKIIQEIVATDFEAAKPEQVTLVSQALVSLPPVWGDRERLKQMIMSFVKFAFKLKKAGQITLLAESDEKEVTVRVEVDEVILSSQELAELFELSVKTDVVGRSELGRGGLELPLTQRLAEKHQGRAWAESDTNKGITFYLTLPVHAPA